MNATEEGYGELYELIGEKTGDEPIELEKEDIGVSLGLVKGNVLCIATIHLLLEEKDEVILL